MCGHSTDNTGAMSDDVDSHVRDVPAVRLFVARRLPSRDVLG